MLQNPGLAVVLVGARKDSETYVRNKKKACDEVGIKSFGATLSEDTSEAEVLKVLVLTYTILCMRFRHSRGPSPASFISATTFML